MKKAACIFLLNLMIIHGKPLDQYIQEAQTYFEAKEIAQAIATMELAVCEYPNSSIAYTKLGDYI